MSDCFDHEVEAWESLDDDRCEGWGYGYGPRPKTCRICGTPGLYWSKSPTGAWYLPHTCKDRSIGPILALRRRFNIGVKHELGSAISRK